MYNLNLEKAEEPEIKLPTSIGTLKKAREFHKKKSTSASLTTIKPLTVWITTNCCKFLEMEIPDHLEGNGKPLQYSCLENPMDGGAWWATVHGVAKSQTQLSNFSLPAS